MYSKGTVSLHVFGSTKNEVYIIPYQVATSSVEATASERPSFEETSSESRITTPGYQQKAKQLSSISSKILSFRHLKKNWDFYDACPINYATIVTGIEFIQHLLNWISDYDLDIDAPFVAPRPDGELQFEWEDEYKYLEIGISPNNHKYEYVAMNDYTGFEDEGETSSEETLTSLLRWYTLEKEID